MKDKTTLYNLAKFQNSKTLLIIFLALICFALPGQTSEKPSEKAVDSSLSENFQSALDDFQKKYGFPGADATQS